MRNRPDSLPPLEEYLAWVQNKPSNSKLESLITDLQRSPTRFGLRPAQMEAFLQVLQSGGILLQNRGTRGNIETGQHGGSVLPKERYLDFAGLLYLGFNLVALREDQPRVVYEEHHPRVANVVNNIGSLLKNNPNLRSIYPEIGNYLITPDQTVNPQKTITLTTLPFDPRKDMYGKLNGKPARDDIEATLNSGPTIQEIIDKLRRSALGDL